MYKTYKRICPCCNELFWTNRSDKKYLDRTHQVYHNNKKQYALKRKLSIRLKPIIKTHDILKKLLGKDLERTFSKEFLLGVGANMAYLTNINYIDNERHPVLIDIAIIAKGPYITLKKVQHD